MPRLEHGTTGNQFETLNRRRRLCEECTFSAKFSSDLKIQSNSTLIHSFVLPAALLLCMAFCAFSKKRAFRCTCTSPPRARRCHFCQLSASRWSQKKNSTTHPTGNTIPHPTLLHPNRRNYNPFLFCRFVLKRNGEKKTLGYRKIWSSHHHHQMVWNLGFSVLMGRQHQHELDAPPRHLVACAGGGG